MRFTCAAGRHAFNAADAADRCTYCRRELDYAVRRHFKRLSDRMLRAAGVEPEREDGAQPRQRTQQEAI